ncbi:MAG: methyl-accepting chemotaxis protein [Pseudomonadota bacterium]|nr:methyl-accepting chemotaxis protein [Pseudomonadota bacterium]
MRNNQPITNDEYVIPQNLTLVSKTDLNGTILECNDAFELASGYSRVELIGQPHNMVRHPDVPEAVFADMWETLKLGVPWTQVVKNRRADGGFYWVKANATPLFTNNKISGYMSVRSYVTPEEIKLTAQAYEDIRNGRARIKNGRVIKGLDFNGIFNLYYRLNPQYQLTIMVAFFYLIPYLAYAALDGHNLLEIVLVGTFGLVPPFIAGLLNLKQDRAKRRTLRQIASGDAYDNVWFDPKTYDGKMASAIKTTALAAQERYEESQYQLDSANRLQTAMDQIGSNVMIADSNLNIIYMNKAMHTFFEEREKRLQTALPQLKADEILGSNIDIFHKNPAHNRAMLAGITETTMAKIVVANYHLDLNVIPVYNRSGIQTSTIVEWQDRTSDVQLLENVGEAINAAKAGLLDRRIDVSQTDGVALQLGQSINELLNNIEKPVNSAVGVAVALSEGDLTEHVNGEYLGRFAVMQDSLNVAVANLGSMMSQTKMAVENVNGGSSQIYQGSVDLNNRTQEQAASLEQTASSMEQMTAAVKQNAENAKQASEVTHTSADLAQSGVSVMDNAIKAMEQINESSQKINDIISLIDSIAFQTNLLALNAAVEAARAGEHGRGFAVVAGEVRTLAQKSADAAKDIRVLIEDTVKKVSEGTHHVKGSGESLHGIVESINNVNLIIEEIASSSSEQSEGVGLVNQAITQIDSAVQQNAAMVEETAATAEELGHMSELMSGNVNQFKLNESLLNGATLAIGNFDFAQARRAHRQWRVKVRAYINEVDVQFDRSTANDGTLCALGKWIYGAGSEYQSLPAYQSLERAHSELHSFIGRILELKDVGDIETANLEMAKLETESNKVIELINALEKDIANGSTGMMSHANFEKQVEHTAPKPLPSPAKTAIKPAKPAPSGGLQTPPPSQATNSDDEWAEF